MEELYLDNIDEFVNDHDKIVTYKWLSLTLGVHVNTAKQMLFHYLDHKRRESSAPLHATYLVSGKLVDNGQTSHKVSVVREEQLEDFKAKMSLIVSVHVYSVQKALLKDSGPLYSVDYDAVKDNLKNCSRFSAIRCAGAAPLASLDRQQTRETQRPPTPEPEVKKCSTNGDARAAFKQAAKPQKGILGMFANKSAPKKQDSSKETKSEPREDPPAVDAPKSKPAAKVNPMANFFGNQTGKKPDKTMKEDEAAKSSSTSEQRHQSSTAEKKEEEEEEEEEEEAAAESQKETKKDGRSKSKRTEDSDGDEEKMEKKKRRRIKRPEPDSSDEDVVPDSPQPMETREPSPSPEKKVESVTHSHRGNSEMKMRKRRRVLRSRTFVDDEGCIVTEKDYESESYSETEEEEVKSSKQAPRDAVKPKLASSSREDEKRSQKKSSSSANKGAKQASIMGFFQKK
ncbi:DNA polymerase delta subunit 3 [Brachyistius frenatus]|uniref:DNA polymerase delta subunit 3 n=1 Tax=Brachyistius frenatus TaxID=100188 RepID=UPI0037E76C5F